MIHVTASLNPENGVATLRFENRSTCSECLNFSVIAKEAGVPFTENVRAAMIQEANDLRNITGDDFSERDPYVTTNLNGQDDRQNFKTSNKACLMEQAKRCRKFVRELMAAAKEAWENDSDKITAEVLKEEFPIEC